MSPGKHDKEQSGPPPNRPGFDGPAELPRIYMKTSLADTPAPGRTIPVTDGNGLKQALESAACGDTISLQAGATFVGLFTLPAKKCDDQHWIIVRSSAPGSALPPQGTRLTPCYAGVAALPGRPDFHCDSPKNVMAKVVLASHGSGPLHFADGANHYRLIGLEVTRDIPGTVYNLALTDKDGVSDHIIYDRVWFHGVAQDETNRGIALGGSTYVAVIDSTFTDFHCTAISGACIDAQAIAGGTGANPMGPYKIVNNFLEGAAETIIFGGGFANQAPADIEIRRNHMFKPLTWMPGNPQFVSATDGRPFIVKNLFELKNATRVLLDGNILENTWGGFSQQGFGILITPKNQAGAGGTNLCPACSITDVTIRNCRISHVASGFQIGNGVSDNGGVPKAGERYSIHDVVVDDVQPTHYKGSGVFAQYSMTPGSSTTPILRDVQIDHVTSFAPAALFILGGPREEPRMFGLSFTNSILTVGDKPIMTTGGGPQRNCSALPDNRSASQVLDDCFGSYAFHHNVIIGDGGWPKGNSNVRKLDDVGFVDFRNRNGGNYRLAGNSKFKHAATDGKDMGADIDAIEKATQGVQ